LRQVRGVTRILEGRESLRLSQVFDTAFKDSRLPEAGKTNTALDNME
jgi:hypothetical protein